MAPNPTAPPTTPQIPVAPLAGTEWVAARAALALRRSAPFIRWWSLALVPLTLLAFAIGFSRGGVATGDASRDRLAEDTVRTARALAASVRASAAAESTLIAARGVLLSPAPAPAGRTVAATTTRPGATPALRSLEAVIGEARRLRTPAAWRAVAADPAVAAGPRMRALADSLDTAEREREALPSGPDRDERAATLTRTINRLGYVIVAIAENRRATLEREAAESGAAPAIPAVAAAPVTPRAPPPDTLPLVAGARTSRDALEAAQRAHAAALDSLRIAAASGGDASDGGLMGGFAVLGVFLLGLAVRVGGAVSTEMRTPTLAHAAEAERTAGLPVVAHARTGLLDGPARFRPSGVDPFRMLFLGLTATGTRARTVLVTGEDPVLAAAAGARLTISAAADHRATLVVDADPAGIAVSRVFRERAEPGLSDALAGAFGWREVARPLGSSDGLPITLLPAGTERDEPARDDALAARIAELTRFRAAYELTVVVAPGDHLANAIALVEASPLVLVAAVGATPVASFGAHARRLKEAGYRIHGIVLWDAPRPTLPSRAELAALLSRQKGRTPGGSFAAVKRAVGTDNKGTNKPV